jgi:hypothetical protein
MAFPKSAADSDRGQEGRRNRPRFYGARSRVSPDTRKGVQVGRVARRARPDIWRHTLLFWLMPTVYPSLP